MQIGIGLFFALICASVISFVAPFIFQWAAGFFDPAPNAPQDCKFMDFRDKTMKEYMACKAQSNSFETRMERLSHKIPWFWIGFIFVGWNMLRNPLKGRTRDDSDDVVYPGQGAWLFLLDIMAQLMFFICLYALLARDRTAFIILGIGVASILLWFVIHKWLMKKYGHPKSEISRP